MRRMNEKGYLELGENLGRNAVTIFGENIELVFHIAVSLHFQNKFAEALELYRWVVDMQPQNTLAVTNIGALHQALGNNDEAKKYYRLCANKMRHDAGFLNNFGLLLLQEKNEDEVQEGVKMLEQALEINPYLENALVNLASYYLDQCYISRADELYRRALPVSESPKLVEIRLATLMSPIVSSWSQMMNERRDMIMRLQLLIDQGKASDEEYRELDAIMDRIHFYIVYSGLNDRYIQESISHVYRLCIRNLTKVSSSLSPKPVAFQMSGYLSSRSSRIKVGFLSKYFGVYEPHGMLLDGIMKFLPRSLFEVYVITTRPNEGKYLSPIVVNSSDHVIFIPLIHTLAFQQISDLKLDILIFADTLCEPTTHFLAQTRMAPLQMAFWGNPLTSGSQFIDYFISSDFMEHPYRSRLPEQDEPYTEQVVLLPGQGIWYSSPDSNDSQEIVRFLNLSLAPQDESFQRTDFGLEEDWFIFFCPQSLFKLHPLFDQVLASILRKSPKAHLVLTTGRRKIWTSIFVDRLTKSLGPYADRCHMIERITSQKFFALIKLADALLHPFPFDGSRTSADSLCVGIPFVTLPSEYLRGRMGASLLRTLDLPELVAHNVSEYIQISVQLSTDQSFYTSMKTLILNRSWLIWNDMMVPYSWTSFLARSTGLSAPSWDNYLASFDLDIARESKLRSMREQNQKSFDLRWGKETWLLDRNGIPHLPQLLSDNEVLPMFDNWKTADVQDLWDPMRRETLLNLAHEHALAGNFIQAFETESLLLKDHPHDPQLFLELGIFQYFLGNYQSALDFCEESYRLLLSKGRSSSQVSGCIGISANYLSDEHKTITFLNQAWELRDDRSPLSQLFNFPLKAIQMSLTTGLRTFHRFDECVGILSSILEISLTSRGGSLVVFSSMYQLSERTVTLIKQLELELKLTGDLSGSFDAIAEIRRIQDSFDFLIVTARDCLIGSLKSHADEVILRSLRDATKLMDSPTRSSNTISEETQIKETSERIILVSQYYAPLSNSSSSNHDIDSTLLKNLANPFISDVYLFNERSYPLDHFPHQEKLHQIVIHKRPTFQTLFQYINDHLSNKFIVLANSDIFFDETLGLIGNNIKELDLKDTIFALSKWTDWEPTDHFIYLTPRIDSQDAWLFRSPLNQNVVESSEFFLGAPRCDNRLASIFTQFGYKILNPVYRIHAIELMSMSRESSLYDMAGAPIGDTLNIFLCNELPKLPEKRQASLSSPDLSIR